MTSTAQPTETGNGLPDYIEMQDGKVDPALRLGLCIGFGLAWLIGVMVWIWGRYWGPSPWMKKKKKAAAPEEGTQAPPAQQGVVREEIEMEPPMMRGAINE